jgi:hypothetical protein
LKLLRIIIIILTVLILFLTLRYFYSTQNHKNFNEEIDEALVHYTKEYCGKEVEIEIEKINNMYSWMYSPDRSVSWYVKTNLGEHYSGSYTQHGAVILGDSPCMPSDTSKNFILNRKEKRFYVEESNTYFENIKLPPGWKSYTPPPGGIINLDIREIYIGLLKTYFVLVALLMLLYWIVRKRTQVDTNLSEEKINRVIGYYVVNILCFFPYLFVIHNVLDESGILQGSSRWVDVSIFIFLCVLFQMLTFTIIRKVKSKWWHLVVTGMPIGLFLYWVLG